MLIVPDPVKGLERAKERCRGAGRCQFWEPWERKQR